MVSRPSRTEMPQEYVANATMPTANISLIVMEPSDQLSHECLHQLVASSLRQLAHFRSRLVGNPLGLGMPVWSEIDNFDPASHVHRATIRPRGDGRELAELIARLSAHDCRNTLWEAWSIDGLAGGRWALAVKASPALDDDGIGAAAVWSRLLRSDPHEHPPKDQTTEPSLGAPCLGQLVADTMTQLLENYVKSLWAVGEAATDALSAARDRWSGVVEPNPMPPAVSSMRGPVPDSVFNAPLTQRRSVAFVSISLADLEKVSYAFGGSVTNVLLAACTLSVRTWFQRHDTVPDNPLLVQMPVGEGLGARGKPLVFGRIRLPVQLDDPVQVLINLHTATERMNHTQTRDAVRSGIGVDLSGVASLFPRRVLREAERLYAKLGRRQRLRPGCHANLSYVHGRSAPSYCGQAKVVGMHNVAPLRGECGLNITLTSCGDALDLSVCVCPDNVPAVDDIATGIAESVDVLMAAAAEFPRGQGRSVVTQLASRAAKMSRGQAH